MRDAWGTVRPMRAGDLDRVMEIWLEANLQAHGFLPGGYWLENQPAARLGVAGSEALVYERDGRILGFAGLVGEHLAGLFVESGSRSRGIGALLIHACKARRETLTLDVYEENPRALAFYQRHGFVEVDRAPDPPPHVSLRMRWRREARV